MTRATPRTIWRCPLCEHGHLAPRRPRKDDARRYCLACTASTGRLVERNSPALERARKAAAVTARTRAAEKRKRAADAAAAKHTRAGIDLVNVLHRVMQLGEAVGCRRPTMTVRRKTTGEYSGYAYFDQNRIVLSLAVNCSAETAVGLLLHEVAHCLTAQRFGSAAARDGQARFGAVADDLIDQWNRKHGSIVTVDRSWGAYRGKYGKANRNRGGRSS